MPGENRAGIKSLLNSCMEILEVFLIVFALSWLIRTYIFEPVKVQDGEMVPTLTIGSDLLEDKYFHRSVNSLNRGEIIVYNRDDRQDRKAKRVIGLPGEKVEIKNGYVFVNGLPIYEPYAATAVSLKFGPVIVPANSVFVLNDNRENQNDSRTSGYILQEQIEGKAFICLWPLTRFGIV